jgi:hypothetical protein
MLASTVTTSDHEKPTCVTVTPKQVEELAAIIKHLEGHTQSYQDIYQGSFVPRHLEGFDLIPLANRPEGNHSPSCAIQANFIDGGLILVIYPQHAVADINGMNTNPPFDVRRSTASRTRQQRATVGSNSSVAGSVSSLSSFWSSCFPFFSRRHQSTTGAE